MPSLQRRVAAIAMTVAATASVFGVVSASAAGPAGPTGELLAQLPKSGAQVCAVSIHNGEEVSIAVGGCGGSLGAFGVVAKTAGGELKRSGPVFFHGAAATILPFREKITSALIVSVNPDCGDDACLTEEVLARSTA